MTHQKQVYDNLSILLIHLEREREKLLWADLIMKRGWFPAMWHASFDYYIYNYFKLHISLIQNNEVFSHRLLLFWIICGDEEVHCLIMFIAGVKLQLRVIYQNGA